MRKKGWIGLTAVAVTVVPFLFSGSLLWLVSAISVWFLSLLLYHLVADRGWSAFQSSFYPRSLLRDPLNLLRLCLLFGLFLLTGITLFSITSGFGIIRGDYSLDEYESKLFYGYQNLPDSITDEEKLRLWGFPSDERKKKIRSFTLGGTLYDRTMADSNTFASYELRDGYFFRLRQNSPSVRSIVGAFNTIGTDRNGLEVFLKDSLFPETPSWGTIGHDVVLSLDTDLQEFCYKALNINGRQRKGAVVIMDPQDGSILALVSSPVVKPENNMLLSAIAAHMDSASLHRARLLDERQYAWHQIKPLQESIPPGSSLKPFIGLLGMSSDLGGYRGGYADAVQFGVNQSLLYAEKSAGETGVRYSMGPALAKSRNSYFTSILHQVEKKSSLQAIASFFNDQLGFGDVISWNTSSNFLRNASFPSRWAIRSSDSVSAVKLLAYQGALDQLAVGGAGQITLSPIYMGMLTSYLANGSFIPKPKFELHRPADTLLAPGINKRFVSRMQQYMKMAVYDGGTGRLLADLPLVIGSKTGTASRLLINRDHRNRIDSAWGWENNFYRLLKKHDVAKIKGYYAWNITFAASKKSTQKNQVAMVVVIMDAMAKNLRGINDPPEDEFGADIAVPVSKKIYAYMLDRGFFNE